MSFLSGLSEELGSPEDVKKRVNIGIIGSFRRPHLEMLKEHLCDKEGFSARVSYDLQEQNPQQPDEDHSAYNVRMSECLIDESQVHIVYFFKEKENEHGINDSATYELGYLRAKRTSTPYTGHCVLILCENGYDARNIGAMRAGIRPKTQDEWDWYDFEEPDDSIGLATQFCYGCMLNPRLMSLIYH
jgi:hypothetical protein